MNAAAVMVSAFLGGVVGAVVAVMADLSWLLVFASYVGGGIAGLLLCGFILWRRATPSQQNTTGSQMAKAKPELSD